MKNEIAEIIFKISNIDKKIILESKNIVKEDILDSFNTLLLIHEIEIKFNVKFDLSTNVLDIIKNVNTIENYVVNYFK